MAKSRRKRERKRPGRAGRQRPSPHRPSDLDREIERVAAEIRRRATEAHSPDTPPERVAAILVEDFEGLPSPVGFALILQESGSTERVLAVAKEVQRLAPGSLAALTFAADIARTITSDLEQTVTLLNEALECDIEPEGAGSMGEHLLGAGMVLRALDIVEEHLLEDPDDEIAQEVRVAALEHLHNRLEAGDALDQVERQVLARFAERELLYRLRDAMSELSARRPELLELMALTTREWLDEVDEDELSSVEELLGRADDAIDDRVEGLVRMAIERAWLRESEDEDEDEDDEVRIEAEPELEDSTSPLALLATEPSTPLEIAHAARAWLETCTYGLWQVADPTPGPGVWVTDIVSGVRRYAAIPPEQLDPAGRWGVVMSALVAIDGTWRSTGAVVHMRPAEGDAAAERVRNATDDVIRALSGKRVRGRAHRRGVPRPHGVLAGAAEPADPIHAELMSKVLGNLLPTIAGDLWGRRASGATLANTEGHRLPGSRSVVDRAHDMPPTAPSGPMTFGASEDEIDVWLAHWPDERIPALGQLTPRVAAKRHDKRVALEALLREFEHDADLLARAGTPAPDISRLRAALGMEHWWKPHA